MGFGVPFSAVPALVGLFDTYPIGTRLRLGIEGGGWWHGAFGGIQDGVALLTAAHFHISAIPPNIVIGFPIPIPTVRIPIRELTFVSL
ncbi:MAG: hypothetical protein P4L49_18555 [Desulfosporosinus sp.]|nr:hypothetical protein [Desulfosporosinus sp.]